MSDEFGLEELFSLNGANSTTTAMTTMATTATKESLLSSSSFSSYIFDIDVSGNSKEISANNSHQLFEPGSNLMRLIKPIMILLIVVMVVGIVGNILNMIVFMNKNMRQGSTFRFLFYLSVLDLLVLVVCATDALTRFGFAFEIRLFSTLTCRLHTFLTYFLIHASSIILMAISVDRALVVTNHSLKSLFKCRKRHNESNRRPTIIEQLNDSDLTLERIKSPGVLAQFLARFHRVDLVVASLLLLLGLLNSHYLIFLDINYIDQSNDSIANDSSGRPLTICFAPLNSIYNEFLISYWIYVDVCVYAVIPFIIMSICSVIILSRIYEKNQKYMHSLVLNPKNELNKANLYRRSKKSRQLLYMLLLTNFYFFLSQLPYCVTFVLFRGTSDETIVGQFLVHVLSYTNNAVNFLFYGFSSQKYRQQLIQLLDCCNNKHKNNHLQPTVCNGKEADATIADRNSIYSMSPLYNVRKLSRQFILGNMNKSIQLNDLKSYGSIQPKGTH